MVVVRKAIVILVTGTLGYSGTAFGQQAPSPGDPPGRVGRLAFTQGTVSFHDAERTDWEAAAVNTPLTSGDALWTEPNAHAEVSIAGTRVRMDGATQLDTMTIDDKQTRLQIDQGRVDVKTFNYDAKQPYELVTPRGTATLQQQGDYYVEAGSTQDPTRLGVRAGAAQFQAPDGRVLAVRAGEVAEITGDGSSMELHTIQSPPPPMPQYWAARDKQVVYDQPPQYLSSGVTGYEDMNYYGAWQNDPEYGQVWYARDVPSGWAPYSTGRWDYQPVYGWTWIDEQPWGFAPYHYGRWAQRNNRWFWVPPERSRPAVYAPALVAFVGGTELGLALGIQNRQPVGWFPLGPREAYVPPYTNNRDYYRRLNLANRVQDRMLEDRWASAQRRDAVGQQQNWMNRRFTTVVPAETFARSQPVQRAAIRVSADKIATAPVAAVAAPPQPTQSIRALMAAPANNAAATTAQVPNTPNTPTAPNQVAPAARASFAGLQAIQPERQQAQKAPGPEVVSRSAVTANTDAKTSTDVKASTDAKVALPKLEPRNASAPPLPQIQGERRPATLQGGPQQATAPANQPAMAPKPGEPQANVPANRPGEPNRAQPGQPNQANLPSVRDRNEQRPEPPRPGQPPQANTQPNAATPNAPATRPGEPPRPPQAQTAPQPAKPGEPPKPQAAPAQQAAPQPQKAEPPKPPQAQTAPQPQHQVTPPAPQPQQQLQLQRQPSAPPPQQQTHAAPPPQPQPQQAPQPQPQRQAAPAPQPQMQQHAPAPPPQPQPQRQAAPPPPQPQHQAAPPPPPRPAAPPPQQAQQAPHPQPAPQPQPAPKPAPPKPDEKK